ncbi:MAG: ChaN family lipoprotein [Bacteroidales bacterium]|nr:ChaN family lipoprotein [Bacteroidales bacterium]MBO5500046.1 ChaN family lipoprotein [Bacteroidales bacterium]
MIGRSSKVLTLGAEMFEAEAKLWDNYWTDYSQLLYLARENSLKLVATNVPRRYVSYVKDNGLEALESLQDKAKSLMAPLPIPFEKSAADQEMFGFIQMMGGKGAGNSYYAEAQAIKDASMAWFISLNFDRKFIHDNGNFHSDNRGGIIPYLEQYLPGKKIVTICSSRQDSINILDKENRGSADFIIVSPTDFPMSY